MNKLEQLRKKAKGLKSRMTVAVFTATLITLGLSFIPSFMTLTESVYAYDAKVKKSHISQVALSIMPSFLQSQPLTFVSTPPDNGTGPTDPDPLPDGEPSDTMGIQTTENATTFPPPEPFPQRPQRPVNDTNGDTNGDTTNGDMRVPPNLNTSGPLPGPLDNNTSAVVDSIVGGIRYIITT